MCVRLDFELKALNPSSETDISVLPAHSIESGRQPTGCSLHVASIQPVLILTWVRTIGKEEARIGITSNS